MTRRARSSSGSVEEPRAAVRGSSGAGRPIGSASGYTLVEALVVVAVIAVVLAIAVPVLTRAADNAEAAGAARYVAAVLSRTRFDAARRQRTLAVRFDRTMPPAFAPYGDGDGDGVTSADIVAGIDRALGPPDRLERHFPGARFGIATSVPAIDATGRLNAADDPIRFGAADQWSVSPLGTSTSGTVYITSRHGAQFAVRIAGVTGRARVLRFDRGSDAWLPY